MQFPQGLRPERRQNSRISTIEVHHLKCLEGNCMRNFSPADERRPQGLRTHLRTLTVRAFSGCSAKNSPSTPENSIFHPFWACRANFFALTPIPGRAGRTFSRIARDDGATLKPATPLHATPRAPGLVWFCGPGVLRVVGCYWWCCAHWRAYWLGESQPSALWGCSSL